MNLRIYVTMAALHIAHCNRAPCIAPENEMQKKKFTVFREEDECFNSTNR